MGIAFDTAAHIISDAAIELGLVTSAISDPYASSVTDANVIRLRQLLKGLGEDLVGEHEWSHLVNIGTIITSSGFANYDLPTRFHRIIEGTVWNNTRDRMLLGPAPAAQWGYITAVSNSTTDTVFRIAQDMFQVRPVSTATETINFQYVSRYWVRRNWQPSTAYVIGDEVINDTGKIYVADTAGTSAATTGPTGTSTNITDGTARWDYSSSMVGSTATTTAYGNLETPTWGGDTVLFPRRLMVLGLKLQFRGDLGFEAIKANSEFGAALSRAKAADGANPVLDITGRSMAGGRWLDHNNLPYTGYGS